MQIQTHFRLESTNPVRPAAHVPAGSPPAPLAAPVAPAAEDVNLCEPAAPPAVEPTEAPAAAPAASAPLVLPTWPEPAAQAPQAISFHGGLGIDIFGDGQSPSSMALLDSRPLDAPAAPSGPSLMDLSPADAQAVGAVRSELREHPVLAKVVEAFILDKDHPMNLVAYLKDGGTRPVVLDHLKRMATLQETAQEDLPALVERTFNPNVELLTSSGEDLTRRDGVNRPEQLREDLLASDPQLFSLGQPQTDEEQGRLDAHARRLRTEVLPSLTRELESLLEDLPAAGGFPAVNARAKSASGMADKISRMRAGNDGKAPRPDYCLADMPDAVGGRITVRNAKQLGQVMARLEERFGKDNIYEKDNFYASPKKRGRPYRCITYTVMHQGVPCEVQLTTLNASLAADLWHNTGYKPIHRLPESELGYLANLQTSVTADEHRTLGAGIA